MNIPTPAEISAAATGAWPYLVSGGIVLAGALGWTAYLARRPERTGEKMTLENKLTFLVAIIIAGVCAQGMGRFFLDKLGFPLTLVIVVGGVLELTAFTCALRARRNVRESADHRAGVDGVAVWVVTALSGAFSAMDADGPEVAVFRLIMPLLAAWLWERGMSIERRKARGGSNIHLRLTPERVLVWLRIAEPSGRTASEVDAHRRLTRVAKAAAKVRALRRDGARDWRIEVAQHRLDRAVRSAVAHAGLAADPARQQALIAQLGSMFNADALADLSPAAPWEGFTSLVQRTGFTVQGHQFTPVRFTAPTRVVHAEVQEPVHSEVQAQVHADVQNHGEEVHEQRRELEPGSGPEPDPTASTEPDETQVHEPRPTQTTKVQRPTLNLGDRAAKKAREVQAVVDLIHDRGYDAVTLTVVQNELGFKKGTAYNRLTEARELVNQAVNQKAVNQ
ncbi:hypothetical protein [Actinomadura decatromicini]|uniref:Uncharacterized protein n=1 Tax=Actinomadura decatromicini TaxID=2604572 RepID=A0A5D3FBK2_9ACTN|nr:hypothetical protein [Actinomadura decatromicini]TYK45120.1 hypothetical protein FXF68_31040 [Actinomadura decatromicini]